MTPHPAPRPRIVFNGKFLASPPTGVHRVASELIRAVGALIEAGEAPSGLEATVLVPLNAVGADLHARIPPKPASFLSGIAKNVPWEQLTVPVATRGTLLVNLCNLGPVLKRPAVTMIHDAQVHITPQSYSWGFRAWYRALQPLLSAQAATVLTVSEYSRDRLIEFGVAPADKIAVIHNGCDHVLRLVPDGRVVERCRLSGKRYVLALASTQAHKNVAVLLEAFGSPSLADVELVLFGSARREDFEARGLRVPPNVTWTGRVTDDELAALIGNAVAYACPSTTEGFGLPPLEAMMLGCPAIVTPCGALPEVCRDAALYAEPSDPDAWRDRILSLVQDTGLATEMRRRGREQAVTFTWAAAARRLLAILGCS